MTRRSLAPTNPQEKAAFGKYEEFHRYGPKKLMRKEAFQIPKSMHRAGRALWVTYRSTKVDPETGRRPRAPQNYKHDHDRGVVCYLRERTELDADGTDVPARIRDCGALVRLGFCLGFCFEDADGEACEVQGVHPLPDLYTTPDGKCLLVIQGQRTVLAMMWGGALGVFARGIDG